MDPSTYQRGDWNSPCAVAESHHNEWQKLCATYLPVDSDDSIWRYSRLSEAGDLNQGWKLHVSATILSANKVFISVAPYLKRRRVLFKAPRSLQELQKINSGLHYGYCQVGKFITVYPRSPEEAVRLARRLRYLTRNQSAPAVPFDSKFRAEGSVYYRYGSFKSLEIENADGTRTHALRDRNGKLVPDMRYSDSSKPCWVVDPFVSDRAKREISPVDSPLKSTFRVFQSLAQRGKGGVYKAIDFSMNPPRLCILKEGRHGGESTWDGRDGYWLAKHEGKVLSSLRAAGIDVTTIHSAFEISGNYYLVTEFIEGETLQDLLSKRRRRLTLSCALRYAVQLSALLSLIHAAGWAWRDCKPANIMVTKDGRLRPVDFEGACSIDRPDPMIWSTPSFMPTIKLPGGGISAQDADLYSLGVVIYFLLAGRLPESPDTLPFEELRRGVPREVSDLVRQLLGTNMRPRLDAEGVFQRLKTVAH
jgi:hypothetical protein